MAKERKDPSAKVRIFFGFAEVEGGDESVQEGVRLIAATVVKAVQGGSSQKLIKAIPSTTNAPEQADMDVELEAEDFDVDDLTPDTDSPERKKKSSSSSSRSPRAAKAQTYSFVNNLNLRPSEKPSLIDFFAEKKPQDRQEQVTLFVYYLSKILGVGAIGADHLYTCFREVNEKAPTSIGDIARNTQNRKGWIHAAESQNIKITVKGENFILHDLPKIKAK